MESEWEYITTKMCTLRRNRLCVCKLSLECELQTDGKHANSMLTFLSLGYALQCSAMYI